MIVRTIPGAPKAALARLTATMDGGFTPIPDVSQAMAQRERTATTNRSAAQSCCTSNMGATGNADFDVSPHLLRP